MIGKILLMSAALAAVSGSALAADLPSRRAPPVYIQPVPVFTWTGVYVGGQVGYEFGRDNFNANNVAFGSYRPDGVVGGAHVGYNLSSLGLFGNLLGAGGVIGIEGDVNGSNYSRSVALFPRCRASAPARVRRSTVRIRGRVGFAVDRALFYATGGAAFADLRKQLFPRAGLQHDDRPHAHRLHGRRRRRIRRHQQLVVSAPNTATRITVPTLTSQAPVSAVRHRETDNRVQVGFSLQVRHVRAPECGRRQILI